MDIKVFVASGDSACSECSQDLERHAWITLDKKLSAICLSCDCPCQT